MQLRITSLGLIAAGLTLSIPFLVPFHLYPLTTFYPEWSAFVIGLLAAAFALIARPVPLLPWAGLALIGFSGLLLLQIAFGQVTYAEKNVIGMFYALWAALLVWSGAALREQYGMERVSKLLQGFLLAGAWLMAMSGYVEYFQIETVFGHFVEPMRTQGMYGAIAQRNLFANYLACGLISAAFLYSRRTIKLPLALLLVLPMAVALAYSGSRSAWIFMFALMVACAMLWRIARTGVGRRPLVFFGIALAAFLLTRLGPASGIVIRDSFEAGIPWLMGGDPSGVPLAPRLLLAWHAWLMFEAHPLFGVGFGEFAWNLFRDATQIVGHESPGNDRNAHNLVLHLLAETGIIGLATVGAGMCAWAWEVLRQRLSAENLWILAVLAIQLAHSMVEFPLWYSQFLGMSAILIGVSGTRGIAFGVSRLGRYLPSLMIAVGFVASAIVFVDYRNFEAWIGRAERAQRAGPAQIEEQFRDLVELRNSSLFAPFLETIGAQMMPIDRELLDAKLSLNTQSMHMYPLPPAACRQAVMLAMKGRHEEAWEEWRRLRIVYPAWEAEFRPQLDRLARADPDGVGKLADKIRDAGWPPNSALPKAGSRVNDICWKPV